jgi:hypothetical protein
MPEEFILRSVNNQDVWVSETENLEIREDTHVRIRIANIQLQPEKLVRSRGGIWQQQPRCKRARQCCDVCECGLLPGSAPLLVAKIVGCVIVIPCLWGLMLAVLNFLRTHQAMIECTDCNWCPQCSVLPGEVLRVCREEWRRSRVITSESSAYDAARSWLPA